MPISALTEKDFRARTFDQAAKAFGRKVPLTTEQFAELAAAQKQRAFRIAEVNNARLIQAVRNRLETAIKSGRPFRDFRAELLKLFEAADVPAPAMHRLKLLFRQNTLQAYSDARRETLDKPHITAAFPFRQYLTVGNGTPGYRNVRRDHAVLHGLVFRWDDPFWKRYTPPWDYNCRCTFRAVRASEVKRKKLKVRGVSHVQRRLKVKPHADFGVDLAGEFDLSGLDAELRKAIDANVKR